MWTRHDHPFEGFTTEALLRPEEARFLRGLFEVPTEWEHHYGTFYECFLAEVTAHVPQGVLDRVREALMRQTGVPLSRDHKVTVQRMEPGQQARVHSDRPLLGFEAARVVLQLNDDWREEDGGLFCTHPTAEGTTDCMRRLPHDNSAFAFVMRGSSYHSVTPVRRTRRTVVLHHWHVGNTPEVRRVLLALGGELRFDGLPTDADAALQRLEEAGDDDAAWRAGMTAALLQRWGLPDEEVAASVRGTSEHPETALAQWVVELLGGSFDVDAWAVLAPRMAVTMAEGAVPVRDLLFPDVGEPRFLR